MKKQDFLGILMVVFVVVLLFGEGSADEAAGSNRGVFLARGGYIIGPEDILIEGYISQNDYDYPLPETGEMNVITATGRKGDKAYIMVGIKGQKVPFEKLPTLNLTFCIDRSGSMSGMMPWVKDSFDVFIDRIRYGDIVSVVDMDVSARTLIGPIVIKNEKDREEFRSLVHELKTGGGTNIYAGMEQSYKVVERNYKPTYVNRVIFLTDGMHNTGPQQREDILNMARTYRKKGINISTCLLGVSADTGLMVDIAIDGGGSSRTISDHDEMVKIFRTELDRMIVPAARELEMRLELSDAVEFGETWGYRFQREGNRVTYYLPTLHNGDYETLFMEVTPSEDFKEGAVGRFSIEYLDLEGRVKSTGHYEIFLTDDAVPENDGLINDPRVREAEGFLTLARGLIDIGQRSIDAAALGTESEKYKSMMARSLEQVQDLTEYLARVNKSLGGGKFSKEKEILNNYKETFTKAGE